MKKTIIIILLTVLLVTSVSAIDLSEFAGRSKKHIKKIIQTVHKMIDNVKSINKLMLNINDRESLIAHKEKLTEILVTQMMYFHILEKTRKAIYSMLSEDKKTKFKKLTKPFIKEYKLHYEKYYVKYNQLERIPGCSRILDKLTKNVHIIAQKRIKNLNSNQVLKYKNEIERLYLKNTRYLVRINTLLSKVQNKGDLLKIKAKYISLLKPYSLNNYFISNISFTKLKNKIPTNRLSDFNNWLKTISNSFNEKLKLFKKKIKSIKKMPGCKKILKNIKKQLLMYIVKYLRS